MDEFRPATFDSLPESYYLCAIVLAVLSLDALRWKHQLRGLFSLMVYGTVVLWYMIDPVTRYSDYRRFSVGEKYDAFLQVTLFLISYRIAAELIRVTPVSSLKQLRGVSVDSGPLIRIILVFWVGLLLIGVSRVNYDLIGALFPIGGRTGSGSYMWHRPRYGGSFSFLVSVASYVYMVLCASFGLLYVVARRQSTRRLMLMMVLLTWPMFVLTGSRHIALTVAMPTILGIVLIRNWTATSKILFLCVCGALINVVMLFAIEFRNDGMGNVLEQGGLARLMKAKHLGMNMCEELMYINRYQKQGKLAVEWGNDYLGNLLNVIPRPMWPSKPFVGKEFAILRVGLFNGEAAATISTGLVGQGVNNFGKWAGPVAPAVIMALICQWMCGIVHAGHLFLRICVVFLCLAKIPNLGRDITLFDLWVVVFAYVATLSYERFIERKARRLHQSVLPRKNSVTSSSLFEYGASQSRR